MSVEEQTRPIEVVQQELSVATNHQTNLPLYTSRRNQWAQTLATKSAEIAAAPDPLIWAARLPKVARLIGVNSRRISELSQSDSRLASLQAEESTTLIKFATEQASNVDRLKSSLRIIEAQVEAGRLPPSVLKHPQKTVENIERGMALIEASKPVELVSPDQTETPRERNERMRQELLSKEQYAAPHSLEAIALVIASAGGQIDRDQLINLYPLRRDKQPYTLANIRYNLSFLIPRLPVRRSRGVASPSELGALQAIEKCVSDNNLREHYPDLLTVHQQFIHWMSDKFSEASKSVSTKVITPTPRTQQIDTDSKEDSEGELTLDDVEIVTSFLASNANTLRANGIPVMSTDLFMQLAAITKGNTQKYDPQKLGDLRIRTLSRLLTEYATEKPIYPEGPIRDLVIYIGSLSSDGGENARMIAELILNPPSADIAISKRRDVHSINPPVIERRSKPLSGPLEIPITRFVQVGAEHQVSVDKLAAERSDVAALVDDVIEAPDAQKTTTTETHTEMILLSTTTTTTAVPEATGEPIARRPITPNMDRADIFADDLAFIRLATQIGAEGTGTFTEVDLMEKFGVTKTQASRLKSRLSLRGELTAAQALMVTYAYERQRGGSPISGRRSIDRLRNIANGVLKVN